MPNNQGIDEQALVEAFTGVHGNADEHERPVVAAQAPVVGEEQKSDKPGRAPGEDAAGEEGGHLHVA